MARKHARIIQHSFTPALQGALLDSYDKQQRGKQLHLRLNLHVVESITSSDLFEKQGQIHEHLQGNYVPIRLQFSRVSELRDSDFFNNLSDLPIYDPTRRISDMLALHQPKRQDVFHLFLMQAQHVDNLMFFARNVMRESITLERDWCPPPSMPARLVPQPTKLHQRFGGDPVTVHVESRRYHQRLFIGGIEIQPNERPQVDVVFNVGEEPSRWVTDDKTSSADRWDNKGEGSEGMSLEVIRNESEWVIERLRKNQRVLIHCAAGMNRSSTICCAVLILLEGLTAERALERVRGHHPWARPDSRHWLKLRWLAKTIAH
jgi:hypothetical protein